MLSRLLLLLIFQLLCLVNSTVFLQNYTLKNPTLIDYASELVRLPLNLTPSVLSDLCVLQLPLRNVIAHQVDKLSLWVLIDLAPASTLALSIESPAGAECANGPDPIPAATANFSEGTLILANGIVELVLAAEPSAGLPPRPFLGLAPSSSGIPLLGSSSWNLTAGLLDRWSGNFTCVLLAAGPLFVEAELLFGFSGGGVAQWNVRLAIAQRGAQVTEEYVGLDVNAGIDISLHSGEWSPTLSVSNGWAYCDQDTPDNPSGMNATTAQQVLPLEPQHRLPSGSLGLLVARWSQSCDAKFFWGVADGLGESRGERGPPSTVLGVMGVRGGEWLWPQYHSQAYDTQRWHLMGPWSAGFGTGFMHLPLHGRRVWYMLGGPFSETADKVWELTQRYAMVELDRLTNVYDLEWPEAGEPPNTTYNASAFHFYSPDTDPTHTVRAQGAALLRSLSNASNAPPCRVSRSCSCKQLLRF